MKIESSKGINVGKLYNISELEPQQRFPKFMELQGNTTFFYMKFEKLNFLKSVSMEKKISGF